MHWEISKRTRAARLDKYSIEDFFPFDWFSCFVLLSHSDALQPMSHQYVQLFTKYIFLRPHLCTSRSCPVLPNGVFEAAEDECHRLILHSSYAFGLYRLRRCPTEPGGCTLPTRESIRRGDACRRPWVGCYSNFASKPCILACRCFYFKSLRSTKYQVPT